MNGQQAQAKTCDKKIMYFAFDNNGTKQPFTVCTLGHEAYNQSVSKFSWATNVNFTAHRYERLLDILIALVEDHYLELGDSMSEIRQNLGKPFNIYVFEDEVCHNKEKKAICTYTKEDVEKLMDDTADAIAYQKVPTRISMISDVL